MKLSTIILSSIMAITVLSSCTTTMYLQKHYPPEISTGEKPVTIVFINNFNYKNPEIVKEKQSSTYQMAVADFTIGLLKEFSNSDSIKVIVGDTLRNDTPAGMLTTLLPIETIADACAKYNAGMLISLDSVNIGFDSRVYYVNSIRMVNLYYRRFYLFGEFFLTAYSPDGEMINRSSVDRSFYYFGRMALTSDVLFDPSIAGASRKISYVAVPCGEDYCRKFIPFKETLVRKVYSGAPFKESNELMKSGDWAKAVSKLEALSNSSNVSVALKAMSNLDVAREGAGK